jgi:hypothetical protein
MDTLNKREPYQIIDTSIGQIALFGLTVGESNNIKKDLKTELQNSNADTYMTSFVKYTCHKVDALIDSKFKPQECTLTQEEISTLNTNDLDKIAKLYIDNNEYLFRKSKLKTEKNGDGVNVISLEYEDVEFPKQQNETDREYLFRLMVEQENKLKASFEKSFGSISNFSKQVQKNMLGTYSIGEQLSKTIKNFQTFNIPKVEPLSVSVEPRFDLDKLTAQISENRLRPFNDISDRLDNLIDVNAQSIEFMIEANKLQNRIAEEIKGSSDTSTRLSKRNIFISLIVLFVGVLSFVFSIYTVRVSNNSSDKYIEKIVTGLDKIDKSINNENVINQKRLNDLEKNLDSVMKQNLILQKELKNLKKQK